MLIVAVVDEVDVFANVFCLVVVAVKPATLLQPGPTALLDILDPNGVRLASLQLRLPDLAAE